MQRTNKKESYKPDKIVIGDVCVIIFQIIAGAAACVRVRAVLHFLVAAAAVRMDGGVRSLSPVAQVAQLDLADTPTVRVKELFQPPRERGFYLDHEGVLRYETPLALQSLPPAERQDADNANLKSELERLYAMASRLGSVDTRVLLKEERDWFPQVTNLYFSAVVNPRIGRTGSPRSLSSLQEMTDEDIMDVALDSGSMRPGAVIWDAKLMYDQKMILFGEITKLWARLRAANENHGDRIVRAIGDKPSISLDADGHLQVLSVVPQDQSGYTDVMLEDLHMMDKQYLANFAETVLGTHHRLLAQHKYAKVSFVSMLQQFQERNAELRRDLAECEYKLALAECKLAKANEELSRQSVKHDVLAAHNARLMAEKDALEERLFDNLEQQPHEHLDQEPRQLRQQVRRGYRTPRRVMSPRSPLAVMPTPAAAPDAPLRRSARRQLTFAGVQVAAAPPRPPIVPAMLLARIQALGREFPLPPTDDN